MADQAAKLREIIKFSSQEHIQHKPRIITITSGKGGVGKTNFVINLAVALSKKGKRVVIFDADLGMANADVLLGVVPSYTLYDVLQGSKTLQEVMISGPENIQLIPGASGMEELANLDNFQRERLMQGLKKLEVDTDFLLIDTGAGISKNVLGFVSAADELIVILTPEPTSLTDAYGIMKIVSKFKLHPAVHMVVNRVNSRQEAMRTISKIEVVTKKFLQLKVSPLGYIHDDKVVNKAVMKQEAFILKYPNSVAADNILQIATNLLQGNFRPPKGTTGFINRLISLFAKE
ncbi:MinD/ParA family protein [Bacillota bacterium LX-D]|nr:MinD/ParA family protein [Bacillota bacterium LX-D]